MKKPVKATKTMRKSKEIAPLDNVQVVTRCEFCMKQFPDPTTARIHIDETHDGEYF